MIIRSQDKMVITDDINLVVCLWETLSHEDTEFCIRNSKYNLGIYSTEEKAIKVLEMIQNAYTNSCKVAISSDGQMQYMVIPVVFQMPQDSEV